MLRPRDTELEAGVASAPQGLAGTPLLARTFQGLPRGGRDGREEEEAAARQRQITFGT